MILLRMMAYREGIGGLLSDDSNAAAKKIGTGSERYAIFINGLELPYVRLKANGQVNSFLQVQGMDTTLLTEMKS